MAINGVSGALSLLALGLGLILSPSDLVAQTLERIEGPAELPPASFEDEVYVDSRGCVFLRAGVGGEVGWIPRVNAQREPLCGETPTLGGSAPVEVEVVPDPAPRPLATTAPEATAPVTSTEAPAVGSQDAEVAAAPVLRQTPAPRAATRPSRTARAVPAPLRCPTGAPVPQRITTISGESVVVCTRGDGTLDGIQMPVGSSREVIVRPAASAPVASDGRTRVWVREVPARVVYPSGKTGQRIVRQSLVVTTATGSRTVIVETKGTSATDRRYVQIGTYRIPANAQAAVQHLRAQGLPVGTAAASIGGHPMQIVLAGPFETRDAAHAALAALQGAGFPDAFLR